MTKKPLRVRGINDKGSTYDENLSTDTVLADPPRPIFSAKSRRGKQNPTNVNDPFALLPEYPEVTAADMDKFNLSLDDVYAVASMEIYGVSITMPRSGLNLSCLVDPRWLNELLVLSKHRGERLFMTIHAVKRIDTDEDE